MSVLRAALWPSAADRPPPGAGGAGAAGGYLGGLPLAGGAAEGAPTGVTAAVAAIHMLAHRLGPMRRIVYEAGDDTRRPVFPAEADFLWGRPNRSEHGAAFWTRAWAMMVGWGEFFLWRRTGPGGSRTVGVDLIHPQQVRVERRADGGKTFILADGSKHREDRVVHVCGLSWTGLRAVTPVRAAWSAHRTAAYGEAHRRNLLGRGNSATQVMMLPEEYMGDAEGMADIHAAWGEAHQGPEGAGSLVTLAAGRADLKTVTIPPADAQLIQGLGMSREDILSVYAPGLPHHLLSWRANASNFGTGVEAQETHLLVHVFEPRMSLVSDPISEELLPDGLRLGWAPDRWLRGDSRAQAEVVTKARQAGVLTRDEGRAVFGYPALAETDDVWRPLNVEAVPVAPSGAAHEGA